MKITQLLLFTILTYRGYGVILMLDADDVLAPDLN